MLKFYLRRLIFFGGIIGAILFLGLNWNRIPLWLDTHTFKEGVRTLDGTPVSSIEDVTDQVVVITVYWSVKCKYCHRQLQDLEVISDHVIAINVRDSEVAVRKYVNENNLTCTVLIGMPQPPSTGLPHTQLLVRDAEGWRLVDEWMGYVSIDKIMEWLE